MRKITILLFILSASVLQATTYNYQLDSKYSESIKIVEYEEITPPEAINPPVPMEPEITIGEDSITYGGGDISILTDESIALPSVNADKIRLIGHQNNFVNITLTESAKLSFYLEKISTKTLSIKIIPVNGNIYDNLGNLILKDHYILNVSSTGWINIPFTLPAGDYMIKNQSNTSAYDVYINEIKVELPTIKELPIGQNSIIYTDFNLSANTLYSISDESNALTTDYYNKAFLIGHQNKFIDKTITVDSKVSIFTNKSLSNNPTIKIISLDGSVFSGASEYILSVGANGWYEIPFTLPIGNYKIMNSVSSSSYQVYITEIKAESI